MAEPTIDRVMALFRRGAALVDAAVTAVEAMRRTLDGSGRDTEAGQDICAELSTLLRTADVDGDNLLVGGTDSQRLSTIFALARDAGGSMRVQTIEIDRDAVCLTERDGGGALGALMLSAQGSDARVRAVAAFRTRIGVATSSLSVAKARLDLQASFLTTVLGNEPTAATVLSIGFDQAAIRKMALAARTQLDRQSLPLSARNRRTLETLFKEAMPGGASPAGADQAADRSRHLPFG